MECSYSPVTWWGRGRGMLEVCGQCHMTVWMHAYTRVVIIIDTGHTVAIEKSDVTG